MKGAANFVGNRVHVVGGKDRLRRERHSGDFHYCFDMKRGMYSVGIRHQGCARIRKVLQYQGLESSSATSGNFEREFGQCRKETLISALRAQSPET
jgi:hypothetical protein